MKKSTLALGLGLAISLGAAGASSAQIAQRDGQRAQGAQQDSTKRRGERGERGQRGPGGPLLRGITLSAAQQSQVQAIDAKYRAQFQAAFPRPQAGAERQRPDSAQRAQRFAQMQQIRQRQSAEVRAVLTPAQQKQFDENLAAAKARGGERGFGRGQGGERGKGPRGERGQKHGR